MSRSTSSVGQILRTASLVILAPHPDDEVLGCGLLIAEAIARGISVTIVILTDGQASHPGSLRWPPRRLGRLRRSETKRALGRMGAAGVTLRFMGWRDGCLDSDAQPLRLRRLLRTAGCRTLLTTSPADFHADHQAAFALARRTGGRGVQLFTYRIWSRVDGKNASRTRHPAQARKRWAAQAYRSQIGNYIDDDPAGFTFDAAALKQLVEQAEVFQFVRGQPSQNPCLRERTHRSLKVGTSDAPYATPF